MGARRSKSAVATLVMALVWTMATPAAGAEPEHFDSFELKGSNRYRLLFEARPPAGKRKLGTLTISIRRGEELAIYSLPARVTGSRIVAELGSLGRIDLRFHSGGRGVTHPRCGRDYPIAFEKGFYTGTVAFHGEGGYTEAGARRVRLTLHPFLDLFYCSLSVEDEADPESPGARLRAVSEKDYLHVVQNAPGEEVKVQALRSERRGRMQIYRVVTGTYPGTAFGFDPALETAELHPPAPFAGSGLYHRAAGTGERWTGDLAVDFPGRPGVPLAGSQFDADLDHARWTEAPPEFERPNLRPWP